MNSQGMSFMTVLFLLIALSATVVVGVMATMPTLQEERSTVTLKRMDVIRNAVVKYREQHGGASPANLDNLVTITGPACAVDINVASLNYKKLTGWCGPYIDRPIQQDPNSFKTDGWGTVFQYAPALLTSCGLNRTCGNGDDIALAL
ncbi:MAG: hypothetical protein A2Z20_11900 [Bdellovibrionales bacterium RBG_16_40_8]|nr:MAG: hypothetical protein A2Z20_11900 [Bdellovibrionales bacterium RBG_16_40_8]